MRIWGPRRPWLRRFAVVMCVVSAAMLVGALTALALGADLHWTSPVVGLLNTVAFLSLWRTTKARTSISGHGVEVHDGYRTRRVPWSQVHGLQVHSRYDSIVRLRLANNQDLVLPGVERDDLPEVQELVNAHVRP